MNDLNNRSNRFKEMEGYTSTTNSLLGKAYMWMTLGLAITGVVAFLVANSPAVAVMIHTNPLISILLFVAQIGLVMYLSMRIFHMSASTAAGIFLLYAALLGVTLSILVFAYTQQQLATAFFISAAMFAGASLFGKITKQDLTSIGHYASMIIIGAIIALLVNMFLRNSMLDYIISFVMVVAFTALTAYDTQKIVSWQEQVDPSDSEALGRLAIIGALHLYLDFINIFLYMLRLLNNRR